MAAAYSLDLRQRVIATIAEGKSRRQAADLFKLGVSTVIRWARRAAETGSCAAAPSGGDHKSKDIEVYKDWLLGLTDSEPDLTLAEIRTRLRETHGLTKSSSCLWRFFARQDVTFKKNSSRRRTGSRGRQSGARGVARQSVVAQSKEAGLHRRDRHHHEHDAVARPRAERAAADW